MIQWTSLEATGQHWDTTTSRVVGTGVVKPPPPGGATLTYTDGPPAGFTITDTGTGEQPLNIPPPAVYAPGTTVVPYISGRPITIDGWQITLQGTPKEGDTVTVGDATLSGDWYKRDTGNASALMALRDVPMFDNATLADGFASAMAQVGTRTQSAQFAAELSSSIAANLERDRTAVSGVNLDEEAARLIQYQQAYQASAKMIQIAQNIFDTLIQGLGR